MNKRKFGLKTQSLFALLISLVVAIIVLCTLNILISRMLDNYFARGTYLSGKTSKYMDRFEAYVSENEIDATDKTMIDSWINNHKAVFTIIYISKDGEMVYDSLLSSWKNSNYSGKLTEVPESSDSDSIAEITIESANEIQADKYVGGNYSDNSWFLKRDINFADGTATVSLYGYFNEWFYTASFIFEFFLSVIMFCVVYVWLVRRKINYVIQLEEEIKVLETGSLEYEVTVKGNDELSSLANSLNQMRMALSENMKTEAEAVRANYALVVAVSHDLRTPLTSLALYLDLIHGGKYQSDEQLHAYIEKSRSKVAQIKQMTDQLFERFYLSKDEKIVFEKPQLPRNIFEDYLSNMTGYLEINGFTVEGNIYWPECKVSVSLDYVGRIMDNISTNIIKYADAAEPVLLKVGENNSMFMIRFSNKINRLEEKMESTEVGVENIKFMMEKMDGECVIHQDRNTYAIELLFRYNKSFK